MITLPTYLLMGTVAHEGDEPLMLTTSRRDLARYLRRTRWEAQPYGTLTLLVQRPDGEGLVPTGYGEHGVLMSRRMTSGGVEVLDKTGMSAFLDDVRTLGGSHLDRYPHDDPPKTDLRFHPLDPASVHTWMRKGTETVWSMLAFNAVAACSPEEWTYLVRAAQLMAERQGVTPGDALRLLPARSWGEMRKALGEDPPARAGCRLESHEMRVVHLVFQWMPDEDVHSLNSWLEVTEH